MCLRVCPRSRPLHREKNYIKLPVRDFVKPFRDFVNPLDVAWSLLKALSEQQVVDPYGYPIKTLHPAIAGMMQRRGTLQPEGQTTPEDRWRYRGGSPPVEIPEGYLQGGWRTSNRPHIDMSMGDKSPEALERGWDDRARALGYEEGVG